MWRCGDMVVEMATVEKAGAASASAKRAAAARAAAAMGAEGGGSEGGGDGGGGGEGGGDGCGGDGGTARARARRLGLGSGVEKKATLQTRSSADPVQPLILTPQP